jgi:hypothetical protein
VVQRILDLRDEPPENLQRVPGPRALLYYFPRHSEGLPENVHLPRSTKTIWKILRQHDRITVDRRRTSKPRDPPAPLQEIQIDFKDDLMVPADPLGKQKPGGGNLSFCRCRYFHLASCPGSRGFHGRNG